jgi:predicted metal-binding membrane protein
VITPRINDQRPFIAVLVSLVALAWLGLLAWGRSPYGRFLSHEAIGDADGLSLGYAGVAAFFIAAWVLMTIAMMLPTVFPLMLLFRRFVASRASSGLLITMLLLGYVLTWALFGAVAHVADLGVHTAVSRSHWLADRSWVLAAGTFVAAGTYQFTPLKYFCLDKCRSPYSFIVEHWRGASPMVDALWLGVHHGIFCVGCCWSLMLLMFAVGTGNAGWMLALGSVMAVEKNLPRGRDLSTPLGILLFAVGVGIFAANIGLGTACAHDGVSCS